MKLKKNHSKEYLKYWHNNEEINIGRYHFDKKSMRGVWVSNVANIDTPKGLPMEEYQQYLKSGIIITDVTGIKSEIVYKIQTILRKDIEYIPAHPMAGREVYGVENSDKNIFKNTFLIYKNVCFSPLSLSICKSISIWRGWLRMLRQKTLWLHVRRQLSTR